jgi:hypothetical protein
MRVCDYSSHGNTKASNATALRGQHLSYAKKVWSTKAPRVAVQWVARFRAFVKCNALLARDPALFAQLCRLTMKLIQIGAKGEVQPFETG